MESIGGPEAALYGELTPLGFRALAAHLRLTADDSFVDLGSGLGRLAVQAASEFGVRRAFGVEFAATRHELAVAALEREAAGVSERVTLLEGDCAAPNLWTAGGPLGDRITVVYAGSLMFSNELMDQLARLIEACPFPLRVVASLKQWASDQAPRGFVEQAPLYCESSWTAPRELTDERDPGTPVYVYARAQT